MYVYKRAEHHETPEKKQEREKKSRYKELVSTVGIIVAAPILALLLTGYVFQAYEVEGASMNTTLRDDDRLIVLKVQRTWSRITRHAYIPERYEVVVFNHSDNYGIGQTTQKQLIKRVIGLPGERVVIKDGKVTVFNGENPRGFDVDSSGEGRGKILGVTTGNIDQTIPANEVFLMGDNRENSLDSRSFGAVRANDIVGKLAARVFPFGDAQRF